MKKHDTSVNEKPKVSSISVRGEEIKLKKCQFCDRTFFSSSGLKTHITRMHKNQSIKEEENEIQNEANKIVQILLKERVLNHKSEEAIEEDIEHEKVNLVEDIDFEEIGKSYEMKCDSCDFVVVGQKKCFALQVLQKHREKCHECDFISKSKIEMKKHMRDQHEVLTSSTSPPLKRKRRITEKNKENPEPMDYEEIVNKSFEDMEITEDEDSKEKRSDLIDAKIIEKRKIDEEKEIKYIKQRNINSNFYKDGI